jgi:hypothetical protein
MKGQREETGYMIDLVRISKTYLPDIKALSDISLGVKKGR